MNGLVVDTSQSSGTLDVSWQDMLNKYWKHIAVVIVVLMLLIVVKYGRDGYMTPDSAIARTISGTQVRDDPQFNEWNKKTLVDVVKSINAS